MESDPIRNHLSFALISLVVLVVVSGNAAGQVAMPSHAAGNSWTYSANMTYSPGFLLVGSLEMSITDTETTYVGPVQYSTLRNEIIGNGTFVGVFQGRNVSGSWTMVGLEHWDVVSYEIVRSETTLVLQGLIEMGGPLSFYFRLQNTTESVVLDDTWEHPYDVGDIGSATLSRTSNETTLVEIGGGLPIHNSTDWSGTVTVTYSCTEYAEMTVPAGAFQIHHTVRTESNGLVEDNYYSDEVGAGVRIDRSLGGVVPIGEWELLSYTYMSSPGSSDDEGLPLLYWIIPVSIVVALILTAYYIEKRRG